MLRNCGTAATWAQRSQALAVTHFLPYRSWGKRLLKTRSSLSATAAWHPSCSFSKVCLQRTHAQTPTRGTGGSLPRPTMAESTHRAQHRSSESPSDLESGGQSSQPPAYLTPTQTHSPMAYSGYSGRRLLQWLEGGTFQALGLSTSHCLPHRKGSSPPS